jgi:hypothetical protein
MFDFLKTVTAFVSNPFRGRTEVKKNSRREEPNSKGERSTRRLVMEVLPDRITPGGSTWLG